MLVLTRCYGEGLKIGEVYIKIERHNSNGNQHKIVIQAPPNMKISRLSGEEIDSLLNPMIEKTCICGCGRTFRVLVGSKQECFGIECQKKTQTNTRSARRIAHDIARAPFGGWSKNAKNRRY